METSLIHYLLVLRTPFGQSPSLATFELDSLLPGGVAAHKPIILLVCHTINRYSPEEVGHESYYFTFMAHAGFLFVLVRGPNLFVEVVY